MLTRNLMDCMNLLLNELGDDIGKAIAWVDSSQDNAWDDHLAEMQVLVSHPKYLADCDYRNEVATYHYNTLTNFIDQYKKVRQVDRFAELFAGVES